MPVITAKADQLNELNLQFSQLPLTAPVFLNSVPKCGTHLLRNIFRMFVPVPQQYHRTFIQYPQLGQHLAAFSRQQPMLSWGHLLFSDDTAIALHDVRHLLIVRDPYDWVLARARFFLSDTFQGSLEPLKSGKVTVEQVLNMMIFGIHGKAPTLNEIFTHNAVSWLSANVTLIRYEELVQQLEQLNEPSAEPYFRTLFSAAGIVLPNDWRERLRIGADRQHSATARENLAGKVFEIPKRLPALQRQMVDFAAPGLRQLLGYPN